MSASPFDRIKKFIEKLNQVDVGKSISKLNEIDVGQAFKRLNEIKIEDLRKLSFADVSSGLNPLVLSISGGVLIGGAGFYFLTFPAIQAWSQNRESLQQYQQESAELPVLRSRLDRLLQKQEQVQRSFDVVKGFVSEESVDLFTSKFFTETARRSSVKLLDITPLALSDPFTCGLPEQVPAAAALPPPPSGETPPQELPPGQPPADAQPAPPAASEGPPESPLTKAFSVTRFKLVLRGDYLNVIAYLRYLNDYQQSIVPLCFQSMAYQEPPEPPSGPDAPEAPQPQVPQYRGRVQADLVVDIPQTSKFGQQAPPQLPSASPPN